MSNGDDDDNIIIVKLRMRVVIPENTTVGQMKAIIAALAGVDNPMAAAIRDKAQHIVDGAIAEAHGGPPVEDGE